MRTRTRRLAAVTLAAAALLPLTPLATPVASAQATDAPSVQALVATRVRLTTTRPVTYNGQSGFVTATVLSRVAGAGIPTGWVDFAVDGVLSDTEPLDAVGRARMPYSLLYPGTFEITAQDSGDATFAPSASAVPLVQTVLANAPDTLVTFRPATVAGGEVSRLIVAVTNNGPTWMPDVAMGVLLPPLPTAIVSLPPGVGCRRAVPNLLYCLTSLPRGATRRIVLEVATSLPGTYSASGYGRNIATGDETSMLATLTVV